MATRRDDRRDEGVVVVEGAPLIAEALAGGCEVLEEYIAPGAAPVGTSPPIVLSPAALARVATTETPRPNLAVVRRPNPGDLNSSSCILVLDRVADPGNVGTLIRSAEAAGVDAVVVTPGTSDPFAPKAVRASAGAVFHQPIHELGLDRVISAGFVTVGTSSHLGEDHRSADWSGSVALILGNEAHGLDVDPDRWVRIVHRGRAESLNVAMAGTLLTFAMVNARAVG